MLHACDIYEDIAIAFGYNNIKEMMPWRTSTVAQQVRNTLWIFRRDVKHTFHRSGRNFQEANWLVLRETNTVKLNFWKFDLGSLVCIQNFPKKQHFLPPDTHTYVCVSGCKKFYFFGKFCVSTKWIISFVFKGVRMFVDTKFE